MDPSVTLVDGAAWNASEPEAVTRPAHVALADLSDAALVDAYKRGIVEAAGVLFSRHRRAVEHICRGRLPDRMSTEDATQETFIRCLKGLGGFQGGEHFGRYAKVVAVSVCNDAGRRRRSHEVELDEAFARRLVDHRHDVEATCIDAMTVENILAGLSAEDSALLMEHHAHDRSVAELAAACGVSVTAVKVRLHRARNRARAFAQAKGLHGLLPVPVFHRWFRPLVERLSSCRPDVVVGCLAAAPFVAGSLFAALPAEHGDAGTAVPTISTNPVVRLAEGTAGHGRSFSLSSGQTVDGGGGDVSAFVPTVSVGREPVETRDDGPTVQFSPIPIPIVNRAVTSSPPEGDSPDYNYEVSAAPAGDQPLIALRVYDEPATAPVHDVGCSTAAAAPTVVTCTGEHSAP
jgi:RNA polymerase sigma factor (sigma-70 family)